MDSSDKIPLSQTGSAGQDWAGGLKPHFCSIFFLAIPFPCSQMAFVPCLPLACGIICAQGAAALWQPPSCSPVQPHHPGQGFLPFFRRAAETAGSCQGHTELLEGEWSKQCCIHIHLHPQGTAFPLLLCGLEVEVLPLSRIEVIFPSVEFVLFMEKNQNEGCWCRQKGQLILR